MSRPQLKLVETSAREPGTDVPSDDFCSPRVYELPVMLSQGRCIQLGFIRRSAGRWEIDERPETRRTRFAGCTERELAEALWLAEAWLGGHYGPLDEYLPEAERTPAGDRVSDRRELSLCRKLRQPSRFMLQPAFRKSACPTLNPYHH